MEKITVAQILQDAAWDAAVRAAAGSLKVVSVAYAATVTPDADSTNALNIGALTGPLTLANPTGTPTDWQLLVINLKASGADRVVTLGNAYVFPASAVVTTPFTVTSGSETVLGLRWNAATSKWRVVSLVSGY